MYMKFGAYIILTLSIFALALSGYKLFLAVTHPIKYTHEIETYSNEYGLPAELVASVINVESSYNEEARSNKNAIGLMQVKLSTAKYLIAYYKLDESIEEEDLFNASTNIRFGCMYIKYLTTRFSNTQTALAAYNAGETRVRVWLSDSHYSDDNNTLKNIPYAETKNYIEKINKNLKFYKKFY